ncbi:MAG TPA: SDR family oxidoreductase, partial [Iamia sp.]|nr:SDR family oxidoreductase [Iamia sp.]
VAVITGGGSGGGRATALRLAEEGAAVVVADIDPARAEAVTAELVAAGAEALAQVADVSDEAAIAAMVEAVIARFGRIDVLHNNAADLGAAAMAADQAITDLDADAWDRCLRINLRGPALCCKHVLPHMVGAGRGVIVNTASTAALQGDVQRTAYGAAKAGLLVLTRNVATTYGHQGIRCNAISPGLMLSPIARESLSAEQLATFAVERLVPEAGVPEDMAGLVAFLASDDARYITGQNIVFDGGTTAHRPSLTLDAWRRTQA